QSLLIGLVGPGVEHRAPAALEVVSGHLEEVGPFVRIRHVSTQAAAELGLKIELGGDDEKPFGPGIALEFDVEALAQRAASAVRGDDVIGKEFAVFGFDLYLLGILGNCGNGTAEQNL